MWKEFVQDWVTVSFGAAGEVIQPEEQWIDTQGFTSAALIQQVPQVTTNLSLVYETAKVKDGPWTVKGTIATGEAPDATNQYVFDGYLTNAPDAVAANRFDRWIRWRIAATGTGHVCFRHVFVFRA